jgi:restriction endonuclease Mrr
VFFWQTGEDARLLAVGHVTSPVFERESSFGAWAVGVALDYKVIPPLTRQEAVENELLRKFRPFTGVQGTNFVVRDPDIVAELDAVLEERLVPIASKQAPESSQRELDAAIKRANQQVTNDLRDYIAEMDPTTFERLIGALLLKIGYTDVNVTKQSGDGGIDVRALLVAGGVASMRTCIQVKRQKTVGRPTVQNLRGSLSAHEAGLLVTSGNFTREAIEEAKDPTKAPIALIDGRMLTELLLEYQIGVRHERVTLFRLQLADLSKEQLETVGGSDI